MKFSIYYCLLTILLSVQAFGVGTFTYDEATNTIEVTDGTSGAPATFNDMYTADQAGTATDLLVAEAGTSAPGNSLTYVIRPTHDKAIIIKCIVAAKTAEADFIFITGTDAWGAAQTESLDVTAGNGTYTTTKRFATATDFDCSDNAAGGGAQWADGTIQVTQDIWGVVWEFTADINYQIDCIVSFGDSLTATYFQSKNELVYFSVEDAFTVKSAATLEIGDLYEDWGITGSAWSYNVDTFLIQHDMIESGESTANLNIYASMLLGQSSSSYYLRALDGTVDFRNNIFGNSNRNTVYWMQTPTEIRRCFFSNLFSFRPEISPDVFDKVHLHRSNAGGIRATSTTVITNTEITSANPDYRTNALNITTIDPVTGVQFPRNATAPTWIKEKYTCNIHVTDKEGNDLQSVDVIIKDSDGNIVSYVDSTANLAELVSIGETAVDVTDGTQFSVGDVILVDSEFMSVDNISTNTLTLTRGFYTFYADVAHANGSDIYIAGSTPTDANGDMAENIIAYKRWIGASETLKDYSPHEFTFTKAGFEPYICKNATVSMPIVWEVKVGGARGAWEVKYR